MLIALNIGVETAILPYHSRFPASSYATRVGLRNYRLVPLVLDAGKPNVFANPPLVSANWSFYVTTAGEGWNPIVHWNSGVCRVKGGGK